jgi:hypothetical protein
MCTVGWGASYLTTRIVHVNPLRGNPVRFSQTCYHEGISAFPHPFIQMEEAAKPI